MTSPVPCIPDTLPLKNLDWGPLVPLLGKANRAVALYDGVLRSVPNPAVLLSPLTSKEAELSSRIEGTQATFQEVLEFESGKDVEDDERKNDIYEIINYRKAIFHAENSLKSYPLCLRTLLEAHSILLDSVRGHSKARGEFRKVQNWIGQHGTNIGRARFIPPKPLDLPEALTNFENYIHYDDADPLAQMAIVHAQFEILHPFLDGNGRVGRMLIPLFLYDKKVLSSPMFYLSAYFEAHRDIYCDRLLAITDQGDWQGWLEFFLEAVRAQAEANSRQASDMLKLYEQMKTTIPEITHSQFSLAALDTIFSAPIFKQPDFAKRSNIPKASAARLLKALQDEGLLEVAIPGSGRRAGILKFPSLLDIINREIFPE